uniref:Phospholipase A-2-activating protein n=1 Tax=Strigamia maritima TaxID=126957 RepID=T1J7G6_STRMM
MASYKLRCNLIGHSMDVRAIALGYLPEDSIITGSRDRSAKIWVPNEDDSSYTEFMSTVNHSNFVSAICVLPPTDEYPKGIILTGSNDRVICAFTIDSSTPLYQLIGHTNTVCALAVGKFGTVLSGSWDQTAKVWLNQKLLMSLTGHAAAVWAVAIMSEQGLILTGSADKTIRMWKAGNCEKIFTGHTDCVRGLTVVSSTEFLSCANDATIRRWNITGDCTQTYYGHTNFVYGVALLQNSDNFVSVGEDRTVRVWKKSENVQTIRLPAQSVWCVTVLKNGDIAVGASDGIARIFTTRAQDQASPELLCAFEEEVSKSTINTGEIGDLKVSDLPGKAALFERGKRDGQTKMVRDGDVVTLHQWNEEETRWIKVGDVVGANETHNPSGSKTVFEGKEYDFVFSVDIEDGKPALNLPYNVTENPWSAAQRFIDKNELSQLFLDQVANFIIENAKGVNLDSLPTQGSSDPLTGGSRYVPQGIGSSQETVRQVSDPFTGSGRYIPSSGSLRPEINNAGDSQVQGSRDSRYFPQVTFLTFDTSNPSAILGKLREFNAKTGDGEHKIEDLMLEEVCKLTNPQTEGNAFQIAGLEKMLQWPHDILFPVLDVLRVAIKHDKVANHFCSEHTAPQFLGYLLEHMRPTALSANQMLALRTLCNMSVCPQGQKILLSNRDSIVGHLLRVLPSNNKNIQIAVSTLFLNFSVMLLLRGDLEAKAQCVSALAMLGQHTKDGEAIFRLLVCLGTLIHLDDDTLSLAISLNLGNFVRDMKKVTDPGKVALCACDLELLLH